MRDSNWEFALDCAAGLGNHYADERGESYLSFWQKGIGVAHDESVVPRWYDQNKLVSRQAALVATELGVHYTLSRE